VDKNDTNGMNGKCFNVVRMVLHEYLKNVSKSFIKTAKRKGISFPLDGPYTATEKIRIYTIFCYTGFNMLVHIFNYIETFCRRS
jgi:hypothetical protein